MPLFRPNAPSRLRLAVSATITVTLALGAALPGVADSDPGRSPGLFTNVVGGSLRPELAFTSPRAAVAAAPETATLGVPGPAGTFYVPYIQTSPTLDVALVQNGPADRSVVDVILDEGTPGAQQVRLTHPPWRTTFQRLSFGEHTLRAKLHVPEEGIPTEIALDGAPVAAARLDHVARGDIVAALGDSTTQGLGEGPWQPGDLAMLSNFPDWVAARHQLAASRPQWLTSDGRNFPQVGPMLSPSSRPSFTVGLATLLERQRGHPVLVINDGWSGTTSDGYLHISVSNYFAQQMTKTQPHTWLINLGANDALVGRSPAEYADRLQAIVSTLETLYGAVSEEIHIACPSYATQPQRNQAEAGYLAPIEQLRAQDHLGAAPNFFGFFHAHPEYIADAVHPNFTGYAATAQLWADALAGTGQPCV